MAVELGERRSLAELVQVRQSAVINTFMTMFFLRKVGAGGEATPEHNPVVGGFPAELKARVDTFWEDAPHDFTEAVVIAQREGVLFERDLERFLEVFEEAASKVTPVPDLPSETPGDMATIRAHVAALAASAARRRDYVGLAREVWSHINAFQPGLQSRMDAEAAEIRARAAKANHIQELLPPWCLAFEERIEPLVEPAVVRGELVMVPLVAVTSGQLAIALPGALVVSIGRGFEQVVQRRREDTERAAARFKILGDPTRLQILRSLIHSPASVSRLATHFELSQPTVSAHIKQLREAGLLESVREGASTVYSASPGAVRAWLEEASSAVTQD